MIGFIAGLPPVILKTVEGLAGTRRVLINVGRSLKLTGPQLFLKILVPAALPTIFVGVRLGLIFTLINVVGVEFSFRVTLVVTWQRGNPEVSRIALARGRLREKSASISSSIRSAPCRCFSNSWVDSILENSGVPINGNGH